MATFCTLIGAALCVVLGVLAIPAAVVTAHEASRRWALPAALLLHVAGWALSCVGGVAAIETVQGIWRATR